MFVDPIKVANAVFLLKHTLSLHLTVTDESRWRQKEASTSARMGGIAQYEDKRGKVRYLNRKSKPEAKEALRDRDDGYVPASKMTVEICAGVCRALHPLDFFGHLTDTQAREGAALS